MIFKPRLVACSSLCLTLLACSPELNWREVHVHGAMVLFPCKPASESRELVLAGAAVTLTLQTCTVADMTFGVSTSELNDPARAATALAQLLEAVGRNLNAQPRTLSAPAIKGMTPYPQTGRVEIAGTLPDGSPVQQQTAVFARGTRVYQASLLGRSLKPEAVDTFFNSIRLSD